MMSWLWGGAAESPTSNSSNPAPIPLSSMVANHHRASALAASAPPPLVSHQPSPSYPNAHHRTYPLSSTSPSPSPMAAGEFAAGQLATSYSPTNNGSAAAVANSSSNTPTPIYGMGQPHPFPIEAISSSSSSISAQPPLGVAQYSGSNNNNNNNNGGVPPALSSSSSAGVQAATLVGHHQQQHVQQPQRSIDALTVRSSDPSSRVASSSVVCCAVGPSQGPAALNASSHHIVKSASGASPSGGSVPSRHTDVPRLVSLIGGLIDFKPIPKLMEAAVLVGKVQQIVEAAEEGRLLNEARAVDELLEKAIIHRDNRNRLARAAAERDGLVDLVTRHPLISYTPSITEERTTAIAAIVSDVKGWIRNRGGLDQILQLVVGGDGPIEAENSAVVGYGLRPFTTSLSIIEALRLKLLESASLLELEVGAVYGCPAAAAAAVGSAVGQKNNSAAVPPPQRADSSSPQQALPMETLSFILLSSLMMEISRVVITVLTTYIVCDDEDFDGEGRGGGGGTQPEQAETRNPLSSSSPTLLTASAASNFALVGSRGVGTSSGAAHTTASPMVSLIVGAKTSSTLSPGSALQHAPRTNTSPSPARNVLTSSSGQAFNSSTNATTAALSSSQGRGSAIRMATSGCSTTALLSPAKANKAFFRSDRRGMVIADQFRELVVMAKSICSAGLVCEEVQTVCSIRLAELMSAVDDTIPMEGVVRRRRTNTLSNTSCAGTSQRGHSVSNASFNSSALPTPSSSTAAGGRWGDVGGGGGVTRAASGRSHHQAMPVSAHVVVSQVSGRGLIASTCPSPTSAPQQHTNNALLGAGEDAIPLEELYCEVSGVRLPPAYSLAFHHGSLDEGANDHCAVHSSSGPSQGDAHDKSTERCTCLRPPWHVLVENNPLLGSLTARGPNGEFPVVHPFAANYLAEVVGPVA